MKKKRWFKKEIKIPFLDIYLMPGSKLRSIRDHQKIWNTNYLNLLELTEKLKERLRRWES